MAIDLSIHIQSIHRSKPGRKTCVYIHVYAYVNMYRTLKIGRSAIFQVITGQTLEKRSIFAEFYIMLCTYQYLLVPHNDSFQPPGHDSARFLKYLLSSIFWVQSLTISLRQLQLGPDGAEGHTSICQLNG